MNEIRETRDRATFEVPDGYEAVRDAQGRATGEIRPTDAPSHPADAVKHMLPCPFCGDEEPMVVQIQGFHHVACQSGPDCRSYGPQEMSPRAAVAAWNSRAPDPVREKLVEALQEAEAVINALDKSGFSQSDVLSVIHAALTDAQAADQ